MSTEHELARKRLERKLQAMERRDFIPPALLDLVGRTARMQLEARAEAAVDAPTEVTEAERHLQGVALVERSRFGWDPAQTRELCDRILDVLAEQPDPLAESAAALRKALDDGDLDLDAACTAYLNGDENFFAAWAEKLPQTPRLAVFLVSAAMTPGLERFAEKVMAQAPKGRTWSHGHCPACGSLPLVSRLLGKEGARHLTCSFCHTEYRAKRIQCPYCLEESMDKLEYFKVPEEPGFQVHVCKSCKMYLKTADFRDLDRDSMPVLDDLESITLDFVAQNAGYVRPTLSAWGF